MLEACRASLSMTMGAFHNAKNSGNFGREKNGTLQSGWRFSGQSGPTLKGGPL